MGARRRERLFGLCKAVTGSHGDIFELHIPLRRTRTHRQRPQQQAVAGEDHAAVHKDATSMAQPQRRRTAFRPRIRDDFG